MHEQAARCSELQHTEGRAPRTARHFGTKLVTPKPAAFFARSRDQRAQEHAFRTHNATFLRIRRHAGGLQCNRAPGAAAMGIEVTSPSENWRKPATRRNKQPPRCRLIPRVKASFTQPRPGTLHRPIANSAACPNLTQVKDRHGQLRLIDAQLLSDPVGTPARSGEQ